MDLNNNLQSTELNSSKPIRICFTNDLQVEMQVPNKTKLNFNQFDKNEFKPFNTRKESQISKDSLKRSNLIESQLFTCLDQFNKLIKSQLNELNVNLNIDFDLNESNNYKTVHKLDKELSHPKTIEDLTFHLSNLIVSTQAALIRCNQINLEDQSDHLKNSSNISDHHFIHYLNGLSIEKLLIYKDQLDQTIKKSNDDLVDELEKRDLIYLKRDELFIQIENLTRKYLQEISSNYSDDNPKV